MLTHPDLDISLYISQGQIYLIEHNLLSFFLILDGVDLACHHIICAQFSPHLLDGFRIGKDSLIIFLCSEFSPLGCAGNDISLARVDESSLNIIDESPNSDMLGAFVVWDFCFTLCCQDESFC